jgi:hypothetical protein
VIRPATPRKAVSAKPRKAKKAGETRDLTTLRNFKVPSTAD